jgi:hypothetical protein
MVPRPGQGPGEDREEPFDPFTRATTTTTIDFTPEASIQLQTHLDRKFSFSLDPILLSRGDRVRGGGDFDDGRSEPVIACLRGLVMTGTALVCQILLILREGTRPSGWSGDRWLRSGVQPYWDQLPEFPRWGWVLIPEDQLDCMRCLSCTHNSCGGTRADRCMVFAGSVIAEVPCFVGCTPENTRMASINNSEALQVAGLYRTCSRSRPSLSSTISILQGTGKVATVIRLPFSNPASKMQNCSGVSGSSYVTSLMHDRVKCGSTLYPAYGISRSQRENFPLKIVIATMIGAKRRYEPTSPFPSRTVVGRQHSSLLCSRMSTYVWPTMFMIL